MQAQGTEHRLPAGPTGWKDEQCDGWAQEEHAATLRAKCAGVYLKALVEAGFTAEQAFDLTRLWLEQRVDGR